MYEVFEHTADLGLRVRAASLEELFVDAARGMFSLIVEDLDSIRPEISTSLDLAGESYDYLLFDWLNELLFTFESRSLLLSKFEVKLDGLRLNGVAWGEKADPARHRLEHEVKAITYHELRVEPTPEGWLAEVIVDI